MRGIATIHNGIRYRSLLEAKWAAFFTNIGWQFEYEPFEGNGYIPDFLILGEASFLVEVKPAHNWRGLEEHTDKVESGLAGVWNGDVVIVGASPVILQDMYGCDFACGLHGQPQGDWDGEIEVPPRFSPETVWWEPGMWSRCPVCQAPSILHQCGIYYRLPCGHQDGGHMWLVNSQEHQALRHHWNAASNQVQWRGSGK